MSIRPKTSFVKKNDDEELQNSDISELNKYLDCFYEESFPTKVKGARMILYMSLEPNNLYEMLNNENFLNVVSRTLKENHNIHSEFCIHLLCFFYGLSAYKNFHEILTNFEIGGACLTIIDFQLKKYTVRKEGLALKLDHPDFAKELEKFTFMIRKQDRILKLAFGLLLNLADNLKVERVLAKKEITSLLIKFLDRSNINLLVIILLFLKKLSIYEVNKNEILKNNIIGQLTKLLGYTHHLIIKISLELVYNLSFEPKFVKQIIGNVDFFKQIISLFIKVKNMRSLIIKILYNISKYPETAILFSETDCMEIIYELIIKFPEPKLELELASLTLNLTTYPQNCEIIAKENKIKLLLERAFKNSDFYLIKIVKNIIKFGENDDLNDMFESYIDQFIETLQTKKSDDSFGTELVEILSSIETDWTDKVEKYGLIEFIETNLEKFNGIQDVLFKLILFLGNISRSPKCAPLISKSKIISLLSKILSTNLSNNNIIFSIVSSLYNLLFWEDTRKKILSQEKLLNMIMKLLKSSNSRVVFISLQFLEVAQLFDSDHTEIVKKKKFKIFNKSLIEHFKRNEIEEDY